MCAGAENEVRAKPMITFCRLLGTVSLIATFLCSPYQVLAADTPTSIVSKACEAQSISESKDKGTQSFDRLLCKRQQLVEIIENGFDELTDSSSMFVAFNANFTRASAEVEKGRGNDRCGITFRPRSELPKPVIQDNANCQDSMAYFFQVSNIFQAKSEQDITQIKNAARQIKELDDELRVKLRDSLDERNMKSYAAIVLICLILSLPIILWISVKMRAIDSYSEKTFMNIIAVTVGLVVFMVGYFTDKIPESLITATVGGCFGYALGRPGSPQQPDGQNVVDLNAGRQVAGRGLPTSQG